MTETYWDPAQQIAWLNSPDLSAWVADLLGRHGTLPGVHPLTVQHRPGAGVSALLQVSSPDSREPLKIGLTTEVLDPSLGAGLPPGYELRTGFGPGGPVTLWLHPHDPRLPGLAAALDPQAVRARWGHGIPITAVGTRAYRPLRRAVLVPQALDPASESPVSAFFLKVLHAKAEDLVLRHQLLHGAGVPVPTVRLPEDSRGPDDTVRDGTIALNVAPGRSLATALAAQQAHPISTTHLLSVLDRMPQECLDLEAKDSWSDRIEDHAGAARAAFPSLQTRIDAVLSRVLEGLASFQPGAVVPTHGDLYEANIFVHDSRVSALLDLDGVGPGHRVDDLACLVAHLAVLPSLDRRYGEVPRQLRWLTPALLADVARHGGDPRGLWVRAASVVLTLVAGISGEDHHDDLTAATDRLGLADLLLDRAR